MRYRLNYCLVWLNYGVAFELCITVGSLDFWVWSLDLGVGIHDLVSPDLWVLSTHLGCMLGLGVWTWKSGLGSLDLESGLGVWTWSLDYGVWSLDFESGLGSLGLESGLGVESGLVSRLWILGPDLESRLRIQSVKFDSRCGSKNPDLEVWSPEFWVRSLD